MLQHHERVVNFNKVGSVNSQLCAKEKLQLVNCETETYGISFLQCPLPLLVTGWVGAVTAQQPQLKCAHICHL